MGGRRLLESSGQQQAENMEVIRDVEWQLGNFTLLEICQIILDAFTLTLSLRGKNLLSGTTRWRRMDRESKLW